MKVSKLRGKIVENNLTLDKVAASLGICPKTFYSRMAGSTEFTREEIMKMADLLHLSDEDILSIFFAE